MQLFCIVKIPQSCYIWPILYLHLRIPNYLLISLLSHPLLWLMETLRLDLVLIHSNAFVYMQELTVGCESNITINSDRKLAKQRLLFNSLRTNYTSIKFVNLSMSALGIFGASCDSLLQMLQDLHFDTNFQKNVVMKVSNIVMKVSNIAMRCSYYLCCGHNTQWTCSNLLNL